GLPSMAFCSMVNDLMFNRYVSCRGRWIGRSMLRPYGARLIHHALFDHKLDLSAFQLNWGGGLGGLFWLNS
nr:hypothetical protein [Ardenticatenaceae bacterium]